MFASASQKKEMLATDEAEPILRNCLLAREGQPPEETLEVATVLVELALLLEAKGQLEEGEEAAKKALAIRERILGSQHPEVGLALLGTDLIARCISHI